MKYGVALLAVFLATASASLIDILTTVHNSAAFNHLPHPEQILVIELIAETREGEVHNFIDQIGFARVITLLDHLPDKEAHLLTQALIKELNIEEHHLTTAKPVSPVGKRDLTTLLHNVTTSKAYAHLSAADQTTLTDILKAAEHHTLQAYIDQAGYATVLTLLDDLTGQGAHKLTTYINNNCGDLMQVETSQKKLLYIFAAKAFTLEK